MLVTTSTMIASCQSFEMLRICFRVQCVNRLNLWRPLSTDSDEEDEERPASTPEKKEGMARFQYMSDNRDLSLNIAQGLIDIAEKNGKQADSQDVCNMIDEMQKIV